MSSVEKYEGCDELDCGQESTGELVVARRDGPELFEIVEEPFDQVSLAIEREIGRPLDSPVCLGRDDCGDAPLIESVEEGIGIVGLVGQKGFRTDLVKQGFGLSEVRSLPRREGNCHRIAEAVDDRMNLRRQSASRSADGLAVFVVFFLAPALC